MGHIGRYTILQEIGRGGMGVVYRCQAPTGEAVAIKVLLDHGSAGEAQQRRFVREADALAQLAHPALVRVREYGEQSQNPFLVLDYVPGRTLTELLAERGRLPPEEAAGLIGRLADGLAHAHERGVVHRDVKPDNVRITPQGQPVLVDFGLAKSLDLAHSRLTQDGRGLGTPGFWSPEQMAGDLEAVGPASDVYALGATLYMMLTGRPPFQGETLVQVTAAQMRPPPAIRKTAPEVPPGLEAICLRCLERDRAARYPTARALKEALDAWLDDDPDLVAPPPRSGPLLAGLGLVIFLGGLGLWLGAQGDPEPAPTATATSPSPAPATASPTPSPAAPTPTPTSSPTPAPATVTSLVPDDPEADARDRATLLAGVDRISLQELTPGPVIAYGPRAFAVLTGRQTVPLRLPRSFVTAARYGEGRVVAFGHDNFLKPALPFMKQASARRLLKNAVDWVGTGEVALIGGSADQATGLAAILGRPVRVAELSALGTPRVIVWGEDVTRLEAAQVEALRRHVREGGGLIVARCPWGVRQIRRRKRPDWNLAADLAEHRVLAPMGVVFDPETYVRATDGTDIRVADNQAASAHAGRALELAFSVAGGTEDAGRVFRASRLLGSLPPIDPLVAQRLARWRSELTDLPPRPDRPLKPSIRLQLLERARPTWRLDAPEEVSAAPDVSAFPGGVPTAIPRVDVVIETDRARSWRSTEAYVAPGEVATIRLEPYVPGWRARVGIHPDQLGAKRWKRWPRITHEFPLDAPTTRIATPYGGPILLSFRGNLLGGKNRITIGGVVRMPVFTADIDTRMPSPKTAAAPWGEITNGLIRITAPSLLLRRLSDPALVLKAWTRFRSYVERMIPAPEGLGPVWFTFDVYPADYTTPAPSPIRLPPGQGGLLPEGLDARRLLTKPGNLGFVALHFTRRWLATDDYVAVNYVLFLSLRDPMSRWSNPLLTKSQGKVAALHAKGGPQAVAAALKTDSSLVMRHLYELNQAFGWTVFTQAFARLSKLTSMATTQQTRRDRWVTALSRAAGRNLIPFFEQRWGRIVGKATRQRLATLPPWSGPKTRSD